MAPNLLAARFRRKERLRKQAEEWRQREAQQTDNDNDNNSNSNNNNNTTTAASSSHNLPVQQESDFTASRKRPYPADGPAKVEKAPQNQALQAARVMQNKKTALTAKPPPPQVWAHRYMPSPSSSVSFSQSPGNKGAVAVTVIATTAVASLPPANNKNSKPRKHYRGDSSSSEEFDLLAAAAELEERRHRLQATAAVPQETETNDQHVARDKPLDMTFKYRADSSDDDGNDDDDSSTKKQTPSTPPHQQTATPSSDKNSTPRNPLARMKETYGHYTKQTYSTLAATGATAPSDTSLWTDDDDEEVGVGAAKLATARAPKKDQKTAKFNDSITEKKPNAKPKKRQPTQSGHPLQVVAINTRLPSDPTEEEEYVSEVQLKPDFEFPKFGPFECQPLPLVADFSATAAGAAHEGEAFEVPASISRFLPPYQKQGIKFVYDAIAKHGGAILGDDMGCGKTVQIISLLAALLGKTGTGKDLIDIQQRRRAVAIRADQVDAERERALLEGRVWTESVPENLLSPWAPVLIIVPPSIVQNWRTDFETWGHFSIVCYESSQRERAVEAIKHGAAEVMVCKKSLFMQEVDIKMLSKIHWRVIVVDEIHQFKNKDGKLAKHLRMLRDAHSSPVVGLTGTLMQNDHAELWNLTDLVSKNYLSTWEQFEASYAKPIKLSRVKDANAHARELGELQAHVLSEKLFSLQIRRTKEEVLKDELPMKDERVVFCEPSELQKQIYRHILKQPDFVLLSQANAPCECGVNQKFFLEYQHLASLEERIEYQRRNKDSVITRRQCCHKTPTIPGEGIDPRAVLWRQHEEHSEDLVECMRCPYCISFNALHILYKCSSHVGLLQLEKMPEHYPVGSKARKEAHKALARAKVFLPPEILHQLPGGSYIRESSIMNDHFSLSGKMIVVNKLLKAIKLQQGRVLLFAESTQSLDLIENFIKSEGYDHLRMDGTTTTTRREELVQEFANSNTFLFLLSTKAMGLGLNLTQANFVIIWDVSWNPSSDAQAQDRAFRIGQKRDVKVFRLVSRGTIEELKYLRQVYKTQLTQETIVDPNDGDREKSARLFRGVAGDKDRKGELFGFANLFKFKDGTFMEYGVDKTDSRDSRRYGVDVHQKENLVKTVEGMDEEEFEAIGEDENMHLDLARRMTVTTESGDEDDVASVLGGESQNVLEICDRAAANLPDDESATVGSPASKGSPVKMTLLPVLEESGVGPTASTPLSPRSLQVRRPDSNASTEAGGQEEWAPMGRLARLLHPVKLELKERDGSVVNVKHETTTLKATQKESATLLPTTAIKPSNGTKEESAPSPLNVTLVGKTTNNIKSGAAGPTSFSAFDLPLPGGSRKKKKRKDA